MAILTDGAPAAGAHKITSAEVRGLLKLRYPAPRNAIVFEVAKSTGYDARRHIDAIVMDLWPSSGFELHGIEIKVSRSDWKRELKDPMKAEELAERVDKLSVCAPAGIVPLDTLPPAWGLIEIDPETKKVTVSRQAEKTVAKPVDRAFMAAVLRAAGRIDTGLVDAVIEEKTRELRQQSDETLRQARRRLEDEKDPDGASWRKLQEAVGDGFPYFDEEVIAGFRILARGGLLRSHGAPLHLADSLSVIADQIRKACSEAHLHKVEPEPLAPFVRGRR